MTVGGGTERRGGGRGARGAARAGELAALYGVQLAYVDALGTERTASRGGGASRCCARWRAPLGDGRGRGRRRARARRARLADGSSSRWSWPGTARRPPPSCVLPQGADRRLRSTGGLALAGARPAGVEAAASSGCVATAERTIDGEAYVAKRLPLPGALPFGYHRLRRVAAAPSGRRGETATVIAAPRVAPTPPPVGQRPTAPERDWGVFLPLYALHGRASWGLGDFARPARARRAGRPALGGGAGRHPAAAGRLPRRAVRAEPLRARQPAVLERAVRRPAAAAGAGARRRRRARVLASPGFAAEVAEALRGARLVDYRRADGAQRPLLAALAEAFFAAPGRRRAPGGLRGVPRRATRGWTTTPPSAPSATARRAALAGLARAACGAGASRPATTRRPTGATTSTSQWAAAEQMAAARQAAAAAGATRPLPRPAARRPSRPPTTSGASASCSCPGRPPARRPTCSSRAARTGASPPSIPSASARTATATSPPPCAHHLEHAGVLRHRPRDAAPPPLLRAAGAGRRARGSTSTTRPRSCTRCSAWSRTSARARIVGENLGTVPEEVDRGARRARHRRHVHPPVRGSTPTSAPARSGPPIAADVAASLNTHDMPTFARLLEGADVDDRLAAGPDRRRRRRSAERAAARELARRRWCAGWARPGGLARAPPSRRCWRRPWRTWRRAPRRWCWSTWRTCGGSCEPQNIPGTTEERPNWRRRARLGLEEFSSRDPGVVAALERVEVARDEIAGRGGGSAGQERRRQMS